LEPQGSIGRWGSMLGVFDVWILGKLDDDRDVFMDLVVFPSIPCTPLAEHVIHIENNVFMLGLYYPMPFLIPYMQAKSVPKK
jgi:hypothetical protein